MRIRRLFVGPLETCCYILSDGVSPEAAIIDPGGGEHQIEAELQAAQLRPTLLINTHGHYDHIAGNTGLKRQFPHLRILIHEEDEICLQKPSKNLSLLMGTAYKSPPADRTLKEDDMVNVGAVTLRVIHLPGHTPGGMALLADREIPPLCFCGDSLFAGGIGRTDFPGGDYDTLLRSIREKLLALTDDTVLYPGHGPETTVRHERETNPFLTDSSLSI